MNTLISWVASWTGGGTNAIFVFVPLAVLLLVAALQIVKFAEIIIIRTKLGGAFIAGVVIAVITSIPELVTEISQAAAGNPGNGLGDDIGSNAFSVLLIGVAAIVSWRFLFLNQLGRGTKLTIGLSFGATLLLTAFLAIGTDVKLGTIGMMPMTMFLIYLASIYVFYRHGDRDAPVELPLRVRNYRLAVAVGWFVFWALAVIALALSANVTISAYQRASHIKAESIGGIFLAITTSLPEIVAFFAFMYKKRPAAAVASLVGSHFFNLGIAFFGDLTYTAGPTFRVPEVHDQLWLAVLLSSLLAMLLLHIGLAKKMPRLFQRRTIYLALPTLMIIGYFVGWLLILLYN